MIKPVLITHSLRSGDQNFKEFVKESKEKVLSTFEKLDIQSAKVSAFTRLKHNRRADPQMIISTNTSALPLLLQVDWFQISISSVITTSSDGRCLSAQQVRDLFQNGPAKNAEVVEEKASNAKPLRRSFFENTVTPTREFVPEPEAPIDRRLVEAFAKMKATSLPLLIEVHGLLNGVFRGEDVKTAIELICDYPTTKWVALQVVRFMLDHSLIERGPKDKDGLQCYTICKIDDETLKAHEESKKNFFADFFENPSPAKKKTPKEAAVGPAVAHEKREAYTSTPELTGEPSVAQKLEKGLLKMKELEELKVYRKVISVEVDSLGSRIDDIEESIRNLTQTLTDLKSERMSKSEEVLVLNARIGELSELETALGVIAKFC